MTPKRFQAITSKYASLRIAVVGDFCLDRYLEIDPLKKERSLETARPVHNVVNVRSQAGGAGTVLNNLCALGVKRIYPVGFCGNDGEGFELKSELEKWSPVALDHFFVSPSRRTFTYTKPLLIRRGKPPEELNRLDLKNWTPTPPVLESKIAAAIASLAGKVDALIVLDQVDKAQTGVVTRRVLEAVKRSASGHRKLIVLADSRRGLRGFPAFIYKMNRAELTALTGTREPLSIERDRASALGLAKKNNHPVFVTLAENGILGAYPNGEFQHRPALPLRGPIDIVGAGDAVTANVVAALASAATLVEALEMAMAAASVVIHKLGTTGTASLAETQRLL